LIVALVLGKEHQDPRAGWWVGAGGRCSGPYHTSRRRRW
jgi:hypothetical protein